ncbi:deoxyribose-phosphate aldolase, partial [Hortaea werneckii]
MATANQAGPVAAVPDQKSVAHNVESRYTNAEWTRFLSEVEKSIKVSEEPCPCPDVGSPALAKTIDHTLLKLDVRPIQFDELCSEARVDRFATVCVRPPFVRKCVSDLKGSGVKVASVIGFHEGTYDLYHKIEETKSSLEAGAEELDIVINYEDLKAEDYSKVYKELATLRMQAPHPVMLKLILETSQLDRSQIIAGCALAAAAHYDFVKTSTGFKGHGATIEHVRLMKACCDNVSVVNGTGRTMQVKASGGIRTIEDAV